MEVRLSVYGQLMKDWIAGNMRSGPIITIYGFFNQPKLEISAKTI